MQQVVNIVCSLVRRRTVRSAAAGAAVEQSPFVISLVVSRYSSHIGEEAGVRLLPLRLKLCEKLLEKHSLTQSTYLVDKWLNASAALKSVVMQCCTLRISDDS